jgi:hypothetical protein
MMNQLRSVTLNTRLICDNTSWTSFLHNLLFVGEESVFMLQLRIVYEGIWKTIVYHVNAAKAVYIH